MKLPVNKILNAFYRKYILKRKKHKRIQLNFQCDTRLVARLRLISKFLGTPQYPLIEHLLELGMAEAYARSVDPTLREELCRHLIEEHLLVPYINPKYKVKSNRATRINNCLKFLRLLELKAGDPESVKIIINRVFTEAMEQHS